MKLKLDSIRLNAGTQPRAKIDEQTVADYAEAMGSGATFPPVVVFYDGESYYLADGFHRVDAAYKCGLDEIEAEVKQGSHRDAILYSVGANSAHGLRRTNDDKRRAVARLLEDEEWSAWSDSEIARRCAVDHKTVATLRADLGISQDARKVERNGKTYTQDTSNIGKTHAPDPVYEMPVNNGPIGEPEAEPEPELEHATDIDGAVSEITIAVQLLMAGLADDVARHAFVNGLIKRLRTLSIQFNQQV